ncbi:MAG TPA: LuxR C-terminal-related transcriptional regulator, partial [Glycomyces sp.]
ISPAVTRGLIAEFARSRPAYAPIEVDGAGVANLTPRETEVLALIGEGRSTAEIAAELGMAEATVKSHVTRVLAKLGLASRVQAAIFAREQGR